MGENDNAITSCVFSLAVWYMDKVINVLLFSLHNNVYYLHIQDTKFSSFLALISIEHLKSFEGNTIKSIQISSIYTERLSSPPVFVRFF